MTKASIDYFLSQIKKSVRSAIEEILSVNVDRNNREIVKYQILTGGKRLRPALAVLICKMLGGKMKDVLYPAAGLEILHNYTLIVDDIIDNSTKRRNKPTLWFKFGKSIAECLGIDYAVAVFQAANKSKNHLLISEIFAKTMKAITDGEILDILFEQYGRKEEPYIVKNRYQNVDEKEYFKMAKTKTAALFQASAEVGGICAKASPRELEYLKNFGLNLGIAFQISDDMLDIFGEEKHFGKKIGKDIMERKLGNLILIYALKELAPSARKKILRTMRKEKIEDKDIKKVIKLIKKTNSYEKANRLGLKFIDQAKKNLNFLPRNKWNNLLREVADFVMLRKK